MSSRIIILRDVLPKSMDADVLHRDQQVAEAYAADKIEREGAHTQLKALLCQLHDLLGPSQLSKCVMPSDMFLGPYDSPSAELVWVDGAMHLVDEARDVKVPVIPPDLLKLENFKRGVLLILHTIDRSPTNQACMNYVHFFNEICFGSELGHSP